MDITKPNLHSFDLYNDYPLPEWSSKPTKDYFLEIIKSGTILDDKKLSDKEFFLVGRLPDLSDIVLEHPSISRKHAVFQHKNNGELYLYDLESTHGTFINNRKIAGRVFIKLNVGDMIKFGASLRFYIVRCLELEKDKTGVDLSTDIGLLQAEKQQKPQENNVKKLYLKMLKSYEGNESGVHRSSSAHKNQGSDNNEITWGISDEEVVYNYQDENEFKMEPSVLRQLPNLNEKQLEKIEQFELKLNKYQNIENEYEELCRRERKDFGLDELSKVKKENFEKKIQETAQQLETLEETLKLMIFREKTEKRKIEKVLEEDTYNDDEYFDRTLDNKKLKKDENDSQEIQGAKNQPAPITYNFQTLKQNLEELLQKRNELNLKILDFQQEKKSEAEEELDELEKYMRANQTALDVQHRKKLLSELETANNEIEEIKKLLRIVRPNYEINKIEPFNQSTEKPIEKIQISQGKSLEKEKFTKPHEKLSQTLENLHKISKEYQEKDKNIKDFSNYEKFRVYDDEDEEENKKKKLNEQKESVIPQKPKVYGVSTKPLPRNLKEKDVENKKGLEDVNWVPPKNQQGDGVTKLNEKFGY